MTLTREPTSIGLVADAPGAVAMREGSAGGLGAGLRYCFVLLTVLALAACEANERASLRGPPPLPSAELPPGHLLDPPVLIGAGDIAGCGILDEDLERPRDFLRLLKKLTGAVYYDEDATAALLDTIPGVVFTTGDNAYPRGRPQDFRDCYHPAWGRHRERTRPSPGNHDYGTPQAAGYFTYFGPAAGEPDKGYYSYDLAGWRVLVLNTVVDIDQGSAQLAWIREELESHEGTCSLAYGHDPRFSSGEHGSEPDMEWIWKALHEAGVELMISGHDHHYERFARLGPGGAADPERGVRQFVVGTGGAYLRPAEQVLPHSEVVNDRTHGLLKLTLHPGRYEWEFVPIEGGEFTDRGSAPCHEPPSTEPPT